MNTTGEQQKMNARATSDRFLGPPDFVTPNVTLHDT